MNSDRIKRDFSYHAPDAEKIKRHEDVRSELRRVAHFIDKSAPDSREKSLALTHLEEVMMWTNAALARDGRPKN